MTAAPSYFHASAVLLVLFHPLLRASWDLWAQTLVRAAWLLILVPAAVRALLRPGELSAAWPKLKGPSAPAALLLAGSALSAAFSAFPHSAVPGFLNDAAAAAFFLAAAGAGAAWRERYRSALAASGPLAAAAAVAASRLFPDPAFAGPLVNPNVLAALLVLTAPLALAQAWEAPAGARRRLWGVLAAFQGLCLLWTQSFLGYLVLIAQAIALAAALERSRGPQWPLWAGVAGAAGAAGMIFSGEWSRIFQGDPDRLAWWKAAAQMWLNNPVIGAGPGAFGEAYPGYRAGAPLATLYAHNAALEWLAERGVAGLAAPAALVWSLRRGSVRGAPLPATALLVSAAGFLAYNLAHIGLSFPGLYWAFCAAAGLLWADFAAVKPPRAAPPARLRALALAALALAAWVGARSWTLFRADQCLARARERIARGAPREALALVERGLELNPREPQLYSLRAGLLARQGRWEQALQDSERSVRLSPFTPRFQEEAERIRSKLSP